MIGVYKIELNGKIYIGSSSKSIKGRWANHLSQLRKGIHKNPHLQNAFNIYGQDSLQFSVLEIVDNPEDVIDVEQKYIDEMHPEYNIRIIAESNRGCKRIGHPLSEETRRILLAANIGKPCSEEKKKKIGLANKGKPSPMRGKHHTEEAKMKISEARMGTKASEETKKKMSMSHKGMTGLKHTDEAKQKVSAANTGRIASEATREKMRTSRYAYIERMREANG